MINIILHGCNGKMGHVVASIAKNDPICQIVAGIDSREGTADFPIFTDIHSCNVSGDVIIDFSTATAVPSLLSFAKEKQIPVVVCTTGLSEETMALLESTSKDVAVLKSANMSVGVNLLMSLLQKAAQLLGDSNFDIEIIEKHHNQKIDAPSGTALALADSINEAMNHKYTYVYDRSQTMEKRTENEIGIHAVRGGTIVGEHSVIFAGQDEIIEFNHLAMSKEIFAVGAIKAAKYLAGKPAGFYTMKHVME